MAKVIDLRSPQVKNVERPHTDEISLARSKRNGLLFALAFIVSVVGFVFLIILWEKESFEGASLKEIDDAQGMKAAKSPENTLAKTAPPKNVPIQPSAAQNAPPEKTPPVQPAKEDEKENTDPLKEASSDDTSTWKDWKSGKNGVELRCPKEYDIREDGRDITFTKDGTSWKMRFYENKNTEELEKWFAGYFNEKDNNSCNFTEGELKAGTCVSKKISLNSASGETSSKCDDAGNFAISPDKTKVLKITLDKAGTEKDMINKILGTFKFSD